ncbi:unnamed protein product [Rotaria sordida]|uniref:Uncharacterized protein n=1 Tax=Rotaria sordida TaxID=392033 RepID=A0A814T6Q8_9BILA|nr:unnamed protein product [Rotaria sordida]
MEKSPFELIFNYNDKQIINQNFTITTELYHDIHLPINCKNNQYRLCLVELSLQIQSDIMSINFWCQPPAFSFENFNQFPKFHTCILPMVNATEQPSITMIINSYDIGKLIPLATANFTNSPQYNVEKKSKTPIFIFNNENITKETLLSRNVRYLMTENDDAIESELDEPDCIMETTNQTNGISNQDDPLSKDDEPDETAAPVDFASDIIPEDDRSQPIGEYDDSLAVNCTAGGPIYGHPNIEWIRVANASYFTIDQRVNRNADPDSDGIDFPKMDTYILQIRMIPYIFLQYVSVPSSNVILLYVVVHYDSGRRYNAYQSKVEQSPVVENFLAKEPTRFFEVYLNATDDGLPPSDVTLDIGYCIAPKHKHPIIVDSDSSFDSFTGTIDVDTYANIPDNSGSISPYTINKPSISTDTLVPSQNLLDTVDVNINVGSDGNVGQELVNNDRGPMIMDNTGPVTQSVIIDGGRIPSINYEAQKPADVRIPSDALVGTVDVSIIDPSASTDNRIPSSPLIGTIDINEIIGRQPGSFGSMPSPNKPVPFSRTPGQCFDQILIIGGSHITMIRSRNPTHQIVGPEINFGGTGYTFSSPSDAYEFEIHFAQPFTMKYVFIPYSANVESFKVEASHAGMLGVFTSTNTKDGLVVDGFPTMLVSMLVITIIHTTDGYLPSHITLNIGVCNPIYSPSNEGNETPEMIDCTPQLRLLGNPKQVTRVDIKTPTIHIKPNNLINPNQDGMDFPTTEEYIIDIVLSKTMSMDSITLNPLSNVDSFKIQCHNSHGYYLEIKSIIGWKTINGLANTQANLIRIILLGTEDGNPPNHISIKIAACVPTGLPKIMRSPFKHELITKRRKPSKYNINRFNIPEDQLTMTYTEQQIPISEELFQPDIVQSPTSVELTANVDIQPIQDSAMGTLSSPILEQPPTSIAYLPLINSQSQFIQNQIPERNIQAQTDIVVETIRQPIIQTQSSPVIMWTPIFTASNVNQPLQSQQFIEKPLPSPALPLSPPNLIVQISPSPTIIGTRIFDQSSSSDAEIPVVIEQQQPIVSSQVPSAVIETIFSPIQLVPQEIVRIQPSPAMHAPIVDTSASISIIEQPSVANIRRPVPLLQQQPMVPPPAPTAVISNIFSPIQSIPQTIVLTQPSPIIDASTVNVSATIQFIEKPIIYQPSPIEIPQTNIIQQPIPAISSSMSSPVIIRTIFSEIQPPPEETVLRLPSPAIDTPRIPAPAYDTLSSPHITGQMTVQVIEHTYSSRIIPSPSSAVSSSYAQPIEQQPVFERTLPSGMIPSISIEIQAPRIHMMPSPIIPPPIIETDATMVPSSIPSSRISTEMCSCQCPISGLVPIVYNNRQQSCTIGTIRKR